MSAFEQLTIPEILSALRAGDRVVLSRAITLVESAMPEHREKAIALLEACLPYAGNSFRIGITGSPGAGKSTFIEAFGTYLIGQGRQLAVLAVDPSSRVTRGSILGDKTRMQQLSRESSVFIRPTASGEHTGGVAAATRETIVLLEAAGFDTILVETVGVGQSETAVYDITDLFILLLIPGAGDELQGIKRGIMEMADVILINKADGSNMERARLAKAEVERAVHLFQPKASGWTTRVQAISALEAMGMDTTWALVEHYFAAMEDTGYLRENRTAQHAKWFTEELNAALLRYVRTHPAYAEMFTRFEAGIRSGELLPPAAVRRLLTELLPS